MKLPTIKELLSHIKTRKVIHEIAKLTLTDYQLELLGAQAKIADYRQAILKRADKNKKVHKVLKNWLYDTLEVPSYKAQGILEINERLRSKLIKQGILVPTSERKSKYGNGSVKYFTYANVIDYFSNPQFKAGYEEYKTHHTANVARAAKAVQTKEAKSLEKVNTYRIKIKHVEPAGIYRTALNSKLNFQYGTRLGYDLPTYDDLNNAPDTDRNR
ncbi:hypothetical protein [Liquorilactobacillus mali]|uniref:hypothetical protein n=1 Tax=Liquorilactobacillus mali TaxID=1618 RepID=UPI0029559815|nr:hypothetical protein [Liquorilactobacillus mali]MDV7757858.1 hypothetical protein [Liquorilactobacillus mali]